MKILAIGDVAGMIGLEHLEKKLRNLKREHNIDFTVVNGENANVVGISPRQAERIFDAGADVITLGNHTWAYRDIIDYLDDNDKIIRPANFAPQCAGQGYTICETNAGSVCVINMLGKYGLDQNTEHPFHCIDRLLSELMGKADVFVMDMHAEATSEKRAMGFYLDGRISAVWGTHTHVQTSDGEVLPKGTGYITDLGMTGAINSVIGVEVDQSIGKFLGDMPQRYRSGTGKCRLEGAIFDIDEASGECQSVTTIRV